MSSSHSQLLFFCLRDKISLTLGGTKSNNNYTTFLFQLVGQNLLRNVAK